MQLSGARALQAGIDLLLPPRCPSCSAVVSQDSSFCAECWSGLRFLDAPFCGVCGEPFAHDPGEETTCGRCTQARPTYTAARAAVAYGDVATRTVLAFKHGDRTHLSRALAAQMARVASDWLEPPALLVPVPLHRWRIWKRGYNQAALLAAALARRSGLPVLQTGLERVRFTRPSGALTRAERFENVREAFRVPPAALARITGAPLILVDDVLTSGATAEACATTLLQSGAESVRVLTFARVVRERPDPHMLPRAGESDGARRDLH